MSTVRTARAGMLSRFSRGRFFVTPRTVARQAPLSMGFSSQECWSGVPFPSPGDLPDPGLEPGSPALQTDSLSTKPLGKPSNHQSGAFCAMACAETASISPGADPQAVHSRLPSSRHTTILYSRMVLVALTPAGSFLLPAPLRCLQPLPTADLPTSRSFAPGVPPLTPAPWDQWSALPCDLGLLQALQKGTGTTSSGFLGLRGWPEALLWTRGICGWV